MKIRTRLFIAYFAIVGASFYFFIDSVVDDFRPTHLAAIEEPMVDMATLLATLVEGEMDTSTIQTGALERLFHSARRKQFTAKIYDMTKRHLNTNVYVTDARGIVLFDSNEGEAEGKDYSRWNDVLRTLRGEYGARSTAGIPDDPNSETLFVAAPIRHGGEIVGVLAVSKPSDSVAVFLSAAQYKLLIAGGIAMIALVALGVAMSFWITWPIDRLIVYAIAVRDGQRAPAPSLGGGEIGALAAAFEEMRSALEGKQYVEQYVQTLTHQMKTPLSAIRGAAELLQEDMPREDRARFLKHLQTESERLQDLIDRMLQLAAVESRTTLRDIEEIDATALVQDIAAQVQPQLSNRKATLTLTGDNSAKLQGERFLLRQAVSNLVENAADFVPDGGAVCIHITTTGGFVEIVIEDNGPGIPAYALDKVFDRFYSLPRPATGAKSSGLGLTFVKEVAELHGGSVSVTNRIEGGVRAVLSIPMSRNSP